MHKKKKKEKEKNREEGDETNESWSFCAMAKVSGPVHPGQRVKVDRSTLGSVRAAPELSIVALQTGRGGVYETTTLPHFQQRNNEEKKEKQTKKNQETGFL